jgi:hypothetical protein
LDEDTVESEEDILQAVQAIENVYSDYHLEVRMELQRLQDQAAEVQLFTFRGSDMEPVRGTIVEVGDDSTREADWKSTYELRKADLKQRKSSGSTVMDSNALTQSEQSSASIRKVAGRLAAQSASTIDPSVTVLPPTPAVPLALSVQGYIAKWTLNEEQSLAFRIIADHADSHDKPPLQMYIGGSAGTGKSRVIDAVRDLFSSRGEGHRIKFCAYMGIAACNIGGMTLHSALYLGHGT